MYNIRKLNEYRYTEKNNISKLIIKNTCEIKVFNTQIPYLKKQVWLKLDEKIVTLINDKIVTIENYLNSKIKFYNELIQRKLPESTKVIIKENKKNKVYYDKFSNSHIVIYFDKNNVRHKKSWSVNKYGNKSKSIAQSYIDFKITTGAVK